MCHESCSHPISGGAHLEEQYITLETEGGTLPVLVVMPGSGPAPAVMIIHDIHGPNVFYQDLARRLAAEGYIAALPDFFFRQGPVKAGDVQAARERSVMVEQAKTFGDIETTLSWLTSHDGSTGRIGTIGFCWGGSMVMLAASRTPTPDACVSFYGFPVRPRTENNPILAIDDEEVAGVRSPILGFWGDQDAAVGMDNLSAYDKALSHHSVPHEFHIYPGLGHAFLTFDPEAEAFEASHRAWTRTLLFLDEYLALARR